MHFWEKCEVEAQLELCDLWKQQFFPSYLSVQEENGATWVKRKPNSQLNS